MKRSDFLQRLIGVAGFGSFNLSNIIPKRKIYLQQFFIAGFRHYAGMNLLEYLQENDLLELRREPDNEHDTCAIAIYWQQEKIGYVPAQENELLSRLIDAQALPLLGVITHLNKKVKPWEKVAIAIYFLQDETFEIPEHAAYLQQVKQPKYSTTKKKIELDLYEKVFDKYKGIVEIETIPIPEIKAYFKKHFNNKEKIIRIGSQEFAHVDTNDIYTYMYNVKPLHPITANNGKEYILFEFEHYPI